MIELILAFYLNHLCLIKQVLIEAEGEPLEGKTMVAEVIRERSRRSGLGYCDVIAQPGQFGSRKVSAPPHAVVEAWTAILQTPKCRAVHFDVHGSKWSRHLTVACYAGGHTFYENIKWRG